MNILWDRRPLTYRGARILTILAIAGRNRAWLQRETRLGVHTIERLLANAQQTPLPRTLRAAAESLAVSPAWLDPAGARRALTLTETDELRQGVQVLGAIAHGKRIDARKFPNVQAEPARAVPHELRSRGARDVYRAVGDSLAGFGILAGDLAYVRPTGRIREVVGSLVVVSVDGKLYLKRLLVAPRAVVLLVSAADGYEPIVIRDSALFALRGEVVASIREYARPA